MENALFELTEKLKYASDVENKLDAILARYRKQNEKRNEDKQALYKMEIANINLCYNNLDKANSLANEIKILKKQVLGILQSNEYSLREFQAIQDIALAHQNFAKTKYFMEMLKAPELRLDDKDIATNADAVFQEEEFAYETQAYISNLTPADAKVVDIRMNQIKKTSLFFTMSLLGLLEDDYINNSNKFKEIEDVVVREENRDLTICKVKQGASCDDPVLKQFYLEHSRYLPCEQKNLKEKVIQVLKIAISRKFQSFNEDQNWLFNFEFIFKDLQILKMRNFSFFDFNRFLTKYHENLKEFIDKKLKEEKPEEILGIIEFKTLYYQTIEKSFNIVPESLGEKLIENEAALLQRFSEVACRKLNEWIDNISVSEIEKFQTRENDFSMDEEGKLVSSGFVNLLQIIKAQLEPIAYNRKIFIYLTGVIKERCKSFQERIKGAMRTELSNALQGSGLSGFEDYCIVFGNSGIRLAQYISSLPFFQSDEVRELQCIFLEILQASNDVLADFVIKTSKSALGHLYLDTWKQTQRQIFLVTIEDFLQDYKRGMSKLSFDKFSGVLINRIYMKYIKTLKTGEIELNKTTSLIVNEDVEKLTILLKKFTDVSKFEGSLQNLKKLCTLINAASAELFILDLKAMVISDKNIDKVLILNLLNKKSNMPEAEKVKAKKAVSEMFVNKEAKKGTFLGRLLSR